MHYKSIYVAATSQHVGKTTSTLGLIHALKAAGMDVGYCKPVGQMYVDYKGRRIDKDAELFGSFMDFEIEPEIHSPIILGPGDTERYIENPDRYDLKGKLIRADRVLRHRHDVVVFEGTGHPGVGSVADVSNSVVADELGCGLIMIVEAGIGNTIDKLDLNLSVFQHKKVPIIGVIINKTREDKIEKVRHYVSKKLAERNIKILGVLPYEEELGLPLMGTICKAVNGEKLFHEEMMDNKIRDILAGSLVDFNSAKNYQSPLLVTSYRRFKEALRRYHQLAKLHPAGESLLSGILLTGEGEITQEQEEFIRENRVPVIRTHIDTYEAVIRISQIEVKINTRTPWKVQKAVELFQKHVDLEPILEGLIPTNDLAQKP